MTMGRVCEKSEKSSEAKQTAGNAKPECPYCGATEGLRIKCDNGWDDPEFTCEDCFTGTDDGPSFDDLPEA